MAKRRGLVSKINLLINRQINAVKNDFKMKPRCSNKKKNLILKKTLEKVFFVI
jgi:hypothetical protein